MILVTGGTGFTGSHLLLNLVLKNDKVRALKRKSSSTYWVKKIFEWYRPDDNHILFDKIEWFDGDINDIFCLDECVYGVKKIYHCAALVSYSPSERGQMLRINVDGTANLVNAALQKNVEKICHCSSISSLGASKAGEVVDESFFWKTSASNSYYAISKFNSEREIWRGSVEGLNVVVINPSIIIGPGNPANSSGQIFKSVIDGLKFHSNGITGFVDVRDVADIMLKLMESDINNERFIVNSENLSYKDVFTKIAKNYGIAPPKYNAGKFLSEIAWRAEWLRSIIVKSKPLITKETARSANKQSFYSNKKIKEALNYEFRTIDKAIHNTCSFLKKYYAK